ncbi:MAG: hypothetical protein R3F62_03240 [Planctomycetota bacterium]
MNRPQRPATPPEKPSSLSPDGLGLEWDERAIVPSPRTLEEFLAAHPEQKPRRRRRGGGLRTALGLGD